MRRRAGWCAVAMLFFSGAASATGLLYTIGPDGYSVPDRLFSFSSTDTPLVTATWIWDMASGALGLFNGGLTYQASNGQLYAVANDSNYNGELVHFGPDGSGLTSDVALTGGVGWVGGLSVGPNQNFFYAIGNVSVGEGEQPVYVPWIYAINPDPSNPLVTPLFAVGDSSRSFYGLTYDPANKLFYAVALDSDGNSFLYTIDTVGGSSQQLGDSLGVGYTGGVAYDAANDLFFANRNDLQGISYLDTISLDPNPSVTNESYFNWPNNWGYWNAGLTFGPENVPEPATGWLAGLALIGAGLARRFIRTHSK